MMKYCLLTRKSLLMLFSCVMVGVFALIIAGSTASKVVATVSAERKIPVYCVDTQEKVCAISFDAAWGNEQTEELLDILDKYDVKATFFLVKQWVDDYPDSVKEIASRGHDIGNHSSTHPHMNSLSAESQLEEIHSCNEAIKALTDNAPTLFRAPYGEYNDSLVECVNAEDMHCVQWNIDSLDWKDPSAEQIVKKISDNLCPGSIILMHNGAKNTPAALPDIIESIQSKGYEIVLIKDLIPEGEYYTDIQGKLHLIEN